MFLKINNTVNYAAKSVLHQNFKYSRSFIMHKSQPAIPSDAGSAECFALAMTVFIAHALGLYSQTIISRCIICSS